MLRPAGTAACAARPSIQPCRAARSWRGLCGTSVPPPGPAPQTHTARPLAGMGTPCSQPGGFGGAFSVASGTRGIKPGKGQRWDRSPDAGRAAKRCAQDTRAAGMELSWAPATRGVTPARRGGGDGCCLPPPRTPNFRASPAQAGTDQPEGVRARRRSSWQRTRVPLAATVAPGGDAEDGRRSRTPTPPSMGLPGPPPPGPLPSPPMRKSRAMASPASSSVSSPSAV